MMAVLDQLLDSLRYPLFELSGTRVTAATLLVGIAIILATRIVARVASATILRLLEGRAVDHGARVALAKIARYLIIVVGALIALSSIGIRLDALVAASAVLLVGVGFGLQNIALNFVSGVLLLIERPIKPGDFVALGDDSGTVVDIGLRATHVLTRDGVTIIVPNSDLVTSRVINHSVPTTSFRIWVHVGVAYGSDAALVERTLMDIARAEAGVLTTPPPEVRLQAFGPSSLEFVLLAWIDHPSHDRLIASRLRFAIDAGFRRAGLVIPVPQHDLHLRSVPPELVRPRESGGAGRPA
jgi:small-conductance mechanosensitive channel